MYYKSTTFYEYRWSSFSEKKNFIPFILRVDKKKGERERGNICKGTPDIEVEQDWSVGLGATLHDRQKIKTIFLVSRTFPWIADSVILLRFECTINPQHFMNIVEAVF